MCRIASLFLLQMLKESMSGEARDFNNIESIPETVEKIHELILENRQPDFD